MDENQYYTLPIYSLSQVLHYVFELQYLTFISEISISAVITNYSQNIFNKYGTTVP